jgi:hypothetical protein
VGAGGAAALAQALLVNRTLQSLDLGGGELGDTQVRGGWRAVGVGGLCVCLLSATVTTGVCV